MKRKKLIKIIVAVVLVVAVVAGSAVFIHTKTSDKFEAVIMTVGTSTVKQTLSTQGVVESTSRGEYLVFDGVVAKEVFVKLGDKVEDGQLLATFEPSSLSGIVSEKQSAYDSAKINYLNSINSANEADAKLPQVIAEITALEKEIERLSAEAEAATEVTTEAATEAQTEAETEKNDVSRPNITFDIPDWVDEIDFKSLVKLLGGSYTVEDLREYFLKLALQGVDKNSVADMIEGLNSGVSIDISTMIDSATAETQLMSAQMSLMGLKAQKTLLETQSNNILGSTYKSLMDTAKLELDAVNELVKKLSGGWYAEGSGVVTELNIVAGQPYVPSQASGGMDINAVMGLLSGDASTTDISGLISSFAGGSASQNIGLAIEYYDSLVASFSLGKYDVLDVKVGQKAVVNSLGHELEGEIIFISPTATSSGSFDITSMLGSAAGTSTGSSNTIPAKVKIINPDESIIIGIDVDIEIELDSVDETVVVPIEAVETDDTGNYVYLFDETNETVTRVPVELGIATDTQYQVLSGCAAGDKIVQNPATTLQEIAAEGEKVAAVYATDSAV